MPKSRITKGIREFFIKFFCSFIRLYQVFISPLFPPCCRYTPTCSQYAMDAIKKYGSVKGIYLAVKRIMRCTPYHKGGYDPVP